MRLYFLFILLKIVVLARAGRARSTPQHKRSLAAKAPSNSSSSSSSNVLADVPLEPNRAVVILPPYSFLQQTMQEKSLRLVVIGGTNSLAVGPSYVKLLQKWVNTSALSSKDSFVRVSPLSTSTVSGIETPVFDLKTRLTQDISRDVLGLTSKDSPKTWPNVLLFEHGQDCWQEDKLLCVFALERLIQHIFDLYEAQHLPHPDVMFVDVMRVERYYHLGKSWNSRQYPQHLLACNGSTLQKEKERDASSRAKAFVVPEQAVYNDRGSSFGAAMVEYARFYRYVVLSTSDAWYPSFVHHFLSHDLCETWPLFEEGHRLTLQGHMELFRIIEHLFEMVFNAKKTSVLPSVYCTDLKFAPLEEYSDTKFWKEFPVPEKKITLDYFKPTQEELRRAYFTIPSDTWGSQIVTDRSLRILTLGGSNTANGNGYAYDLEKLIKNSTWGPNFADLNISENYLINGGISGWGPTVIRMPFETELSPSKWPNLIIMEFSVNCGGGWGCVEGIEKVSSYYKHLYGLHKLPMPDILLLELFRADQDRGTDPDCDEHVLLYHHNSNLTKTIAEDTLYKLNSRFHDRGAIMASALAELARFYRYPVISLVDAFYPSLIRYKDTHLSCGHWPFTHDNVHIGFEGQAHAVNLVISFLEKRIQKVKKSSPAMKSKPESNLQPLLQQHLLPELIYKGGDVASEYRVWGAVPFNELMRHIIIDQGNFTYTELRNHPDGNHQCLGSTRKGDKLLIRGEVHPVYVHKIPEEQRAKVTFTLVLGVLHSWDHSYIGSLKCALYPARVEHDQYLKTSEIPLASQTIHAYEYNHVPVHDSTPRNIVITKELDAKQHIIECENLEENRLGCITHLSIYTNR